MLSFVEQYFRPRMGVGDMDLDRGVRQYIGNRYSESEGSYVIKSMKHAIDSGFQEMSDEDLQELVSKLSSQILCGSFSPALLRDVVYWYEEFRKLGFKCVLSKDGLISCCQDVMLRDLEGAIAFSNYPHTSLPVVRRLTLYLPHYRPSLLTRIKIMFRRRLRSVWCRLILHLILWSCCLIHR